MTRPLLNPELSYFPLAHVSRELNTLTCTNHIIIKGGDVDGVWCVLFLTQKETNITTAPDDPKKSPAQQQHVEGATTYIAIFHLVINGQV